MRSSKRCSQSGENAQYKQGECQNSNNRTQTLNYRKTKNKNIRTCSCEHRGILNVVPNIGVVHQYGGQSSSNQSGTVGICINRHRHIGSASAIGRAIGSAIQLSLLFNDALQTMIHCGCPMCQHVVLPICCFKLQTLFICTRTKVAAGN